MSLDTIKSEIQTLTDSEHAQLTSWIGSTEAARRRDAKTASVAVAGAVAAMQDAGTIPKPAAATAPPTTPAEVSGVPAWVNPGTNQAKMYRKGSIVRWNGKIWQSATDGLNSWEPGAAGVYDFIWRDITPAPPANTITPSPATSDGTQASPIPFKAGLALTTGQFISFKGSTYKVLQGHTTQDSWPPEAAHSLFQKVS